MQSLAIVLCLVAASSAARMPLSRQRRQESKIVGGTAADIRDFPYQCSLRSFGQHICGCSIISGEYLLTAAHCTDNQMFLSVRCGSNSTTKGGTVAPVTKIIQHEKYDSQTVNNDISILQAYVGGDGIAKKIDMSSSGCNITAGTPCNATGWGDLSENGASTTLLQKVVLPIVDRASCNDSYGGAVSETMICAGYTEGGKDTCQGDSGGPLVSFGQQVGIVSWGNGCARPNYPGIYTCVSYFRDWIRSKIGF